MIRAWLGRAAYHHRPTDLHFAVESVTARSYRPSRQDWFAHHRRPEVIDDVPVVNAPFLHSPPTSLVVEPLTFLLNVDNVDGPHPKHLNRQMTIRQGLMHLHLNSPPTHIIW